MDTPILREDHRESTRQMEALEVGAKLPFAGGETIILAMGPVHRGTVGSYAWRRVLHYATHNPDHPFIVHALHYNDEARLGHERVWCFNNGDYCEGVQTAVEVFNDRVKAGG
jgi:hypothetical protein